MARIKNLVEGCTTNVAYPYLTAAGSLTLQAHNELVNPFNAEDISWKPTDVKDEKCIALAYADKRVYEERLDQVFGPQNWSVELEVSTAPYKKVVKERRKNYKDPNSEIVTPAGVIEGYKVFVIATVKVNGVGSKASTSVAETDDENSIMTAEAQAFKRACSIYGIGKYLYNLPRIECEYKWKKIVNPPTLPEWALPAIRCEDCLEKITTTEFKDSNNNILSWNSTETVKRSQSHFSKNLCVACMKLRREKTVPTDVEKKVAE